MSAGDWAEAETGNASAAPTARRGSVVFISLSFPRCLRPVSGPPGNIIDLNQDQGKRAAQLTASASPHSGLALAPHAVRPFHPSEKCLLLDPKPILPEDKGMSASQGKTGNGVDPALCRHVTLALKVLNLLHTGRGDGDRAGDHPDRFDALLVAVPPPRGPGHSISVGWYTSSLPC